MLTPTGSSLRTCDGPIIMRFFGCTSCVSWVVYSAAAHLRCAACACTRAAQHARRESLGCTE
eukprot:7722139-Pyramimonas_sp.AAC.1